jgi:hypothetical protein
MYCPNPMEGTFVTDDNMIKFRYETLTLFNKEIVASTIFSSKV